MTGLSLRVWGLRAVWGQAGKGSQLAILAWLEKGASGPAGVRMEQAGQRPGPQSYSWSCLNSVDGDKD